GGRDRGGPRDDRGGRGGRDDRGGRGGRDDRGGRGGRDDRGGRREPNRGQRRDDAPSDAVAVSFEDEFDNEFNG
ncbi:MAG: hypothetical protein ACO33B_01865, partial [Ilumatobacteraceae bacterium]